MIALHTSVCIQLCLFFTSLIKISDLGTLEAKHTPPICCFHHVLLRLLFVSDYKTFQSFCALFSPFYCRLFLVSFDQTFSSLQLSCDLCDVLVFCWLGMACVSCFEIFSDSIFRIQRNGFQMLHTLSKCHIVNFGTSFSFPKRNLNQISSSTHCRCKSARF